MRGGELQHLFVHIDVSNFRGIDVVTQQPGVGWVQVWVQSRIKPTAALPMCRFLFSKSRVIKQNV